MTPAERERTSTARIATVQIKTGQIDWAALTDRVLACCADIAACTEVPGQITRTFLCAPMRDVHARLGSWAAELNLETQVDAGGNWRAVRRSADAAAPTLIIASHLDSVPNAGAYDGVLGVVLGLALLEAQGAVPLPYHVELVGFSEEEGVRFSVPFIGSRALIGTADVLLDLADTQGQTVAQAITAYGLDPAELDAARFVGEVLGYFEIHIEQGPVLEAEGRAAAPVSAIAGQARLNLSLTGKANHAGTTPMGLRRDALTGASELVLAAEELARQTPGLVATIGSMHVLPGASNVIPGEVQFTLDVRHAEDAVRMEALSKLLKRAEQIATERSLTFASELRMEERATPMDPGLGALLAAALEAEGRPAAPLVSGAGHDAMLVGQFWPAVMLFVRSPGGLSHHPDETVLPGDVEVALKVGTRFLRLLADQGR
ncbi:allantoate amidohydrolase [Deinococcus alpinitundrae]|uniref:allantoate amidohydrolase n=1 Tax=Deinococcus alpinitundrae TaxID=468913 RepID=UPI0013795234|nr:allantoate amidohydrolase [Deinococcus alpinitundrae]